MTSFQSELSKAMLVCGVLSIAGCLAVMASFYKRPKLWNNKHNRLIFFIAVSDLLAAIGMAFGLTEDHTPLCEAQVFLTNAPPLWSIFWTVVVAYNVVQLLRRPVLRSVEAASSESISWKLHAAIWTIPVLVTFGILTTNRFGCSPGEDPCWCYIGERPDSPYWGTKFWTILSFYLWMWLALLLFVCLFGYAMYKFRSDRSADARVRRLLVQKLIGYPLIIIVCWFPAMYTDVDLSAGGEGLLEYRSTYLLFVCLPTLQGAFTAVFFFGMQIYSRVTKKSFKHLLLADFFSSLHPFRRLTNLRGGARRQQELAPTVKMEDLRNELNLDDKATKNIRANPNVVVGRLPLRDYAAGAAVVPGLQNLGTAPLSNVNKSPAAQDTWDQTPNIAGQTDGARTGAATAGVVVHKGEAVSDPIILLSLGGISAAGANVDLEKQ